MKQLNCDRVIFIARPAPFALRQDESWIGHHGDPDQPYWSLTFGQATSDRRQYRVLDVMLEQTPAEAIAVADALETDADFLVPSGTTRRSSEPTDSRKQRRSRSG